MPAIPWILGALGVGATGGVIASSGITRLIQLAVVGGAILYLVKK
ncbi:MAG: hypothetical protein R8K20_11745 [Gallionellaceae bacterium]